MSIITLTTDFGYKDYFVGALKGKIISRISDAVIIDISHGIDLFNIFEAAYCIEAAFSSFPKGSIHIIGVDMECKTTSPHVVMHYDDHYFICADNGILNHLLQKKTAQKLYSIAIPKHLQEVSSDIEIFATVACHIARGGLLNSIGKEITNLTQLNLITPSFSADLKELKGQIIYIDEFGNCVTNITRKLFFEITQNKPFQIVVRNRKISRIHENYSDFIITENKQLKDFEGELLALFNENSHLEIAIYKSNPKTIGAASTLLGLNFRDTIIINIK